MFRYDDDLPPVWCPFKRPGGLLNDGDFVAWPYDGVIVEGVVVSQYRSDEDVCTVKIESGHRAKGLVVVVPLRLISLRNHV